MHGAGSVGLSVLSGDVRLLSGAAPVVAGPRSTRVPCPCDRVCVLSAAGLRIY